MVSYAKSKPSKSFLLDIPIILIFFAYLGYSFWFKYHRWEVFHPSMDYHAYMQMLWNSKNGDWLQFNGLKADVRMMFQYHLAVILLPLAVFYFLIPHQLTLYFLSTLLLASSVIPLYLLGRKFLHNRLSAYLICLTFLFYPPFINADLAGFSEEVLAIPMILFALYFLLVNKNRWFLLFCFLTLTIKINMVAAVFSLGILALLQRKYKLALIACLSSVGWLLFALIIISRIYPVPESEAGEASYIWWFFSIYGDTPLEIITTMITRPDIAIKTVFTEHKKIYINDLFRPLSYLPLFSPYTLFGLPNFLINILSSNTRLATVYNYYQTALLPFIFLGLIHTFSLVARLLKKVIKLKLIKIAYIEPILPLGGFLFLILSYNKTALPAWLLPYNVNYNHAFYTKTQKEVALSELVKHIPQTFSLGTDEKFMEHLAERRWYYDAGKFDQFMPELVLTDVQNWEKISEKLSQSDQYTKLLEYFYVNLFVKKDNLQIKQLSDNYKLDPDKEYIVFLPSKNFVFRPNFQDLPQRTLTLDYIRDMAQPFVAQRETLSNFTFIGFAVNKPQGNVVIKIFADVNNKPTGNLMFEKTLSVAEFSQKKDIFNIDVNKSGFVPKEKYWVVFTMDTQNSGYDRLDFGSFISEKELPFPVTRLEPDWLDNWLENKSGLETTFYFDLVNISKYNEIGFLGLDDGSLLTSGKGEQVTSRLDSLIKTNPQNYEQYTIIESQY